MTANAPGGQQSAVAIGELPLAEVAGIRQFVYRMIAALFLYPDTDRLVDLADAAREAQADDDLTAIFPHSDAWQQTLALLSNMSEHDRTIIQKEFTQLFEAVTGAPPCPVVESFYRERGGQETGWITAQLIQRFQQAGLAVASSTSTAPDHIAVELEFMAFLCGHEQLAWTGHVADSGMRSLKRQRAFLRRHLSQWLPDLAGRIAVTCPNGFHAVAAEAARAFVYHDTDLIDLLIENLDDDVTATGSEIHDT
jgi:putative dimethyl sulfoxide reductase chaperone